MALALTDFRHQTVINPNRLPASAGDMRSLGVFGMPSNVYLRDSGCVLGTNRPPLSPSSQLFESLAGLDEEDEQTLRMEDEPSNNVEEPINNVSYNIYDLPNVAWNSAQSFTEEFSADFSPQPDGGCGSRYNSANVDQDGYNMCFSSVVSQCETPSADDLERNVINPFDDEVSPRTYQEMVKSIKEDGLSLLPGQGLSLAKEDPYHGHNQVSSPMDITSTFVEAISHGSHHTTTPHPSGYVSGESQGEQMQLASTNRVANPIPSPSISAASPVMPSTPGFQCSEVEQVMSKDGDEINVIFSSHKASNDCRNWYGALMQVVPEVVKPQPTVKRDHLQFLVPDEAFPLVTWCMINRSGKIRARIIQELARIIAGLHQNKLAKGLCFFGALTLSESVFVAVDPSSGEPQLHIVPNFMAFWKFASSRSDSDPSTPRQGRLQDVKQFVRILEHTIVRPAKHKEFMVSSALYNACKNCIIEGNEGDKMPIFHQRLGGHKLAYIQLSSDNMTYDVVCFDHEILESCLAKLTQWKVVRPSSLTNPNAVVYGLYCGGRMILCTEELANLQLTLTMRQLPVEKVRRMKGNPLLLAIK